MESEDEEQSAHKHHIHYYYSRARDSRKSEMAVSHTVVLDVLVLITV